MEIICINKFNCHYSIKYEGVVKCIYRKTNMQLEYIVAHRIEQIIKR